MSIVIIIANSSSLQPAFQVFLFASMSGLRGERLQASRRQPETNTITSACLGLFVVLELNHGQMAHDISSHTGSISIKLLAYQYGVILQGYRKRKSLLQTG